MSYLTVVPLYIRRGSFKRALKWFESFTGHGRLRKDFFYIFRDALMNELDINDPFKCSECGITEHNGKVIIMDMDHIDGNPHNNSIKNIRFICPNCHWQAPTSYNRKISIDKLYEQKLSLGVV